MRYYACVTDNLPRIEAQPISDGKAESPQIFRQE
jgi:hypothetical protein